MIAYVKGTLVDYESDCAVVDVNGFGINVFVSGSTAEHLGSFGSEVKLYTYTAVREDAFNLYGFTSKSELQLFKKLITVNGIGPKAGLSLLSAFDVDTLCFAIISGDVKTISKAPGIGKKTAERIILDLKDKVGSANSFVNEENDSITFSTANETGAVAEAISALVALGYSRTEASNAVNKVNDAFEMDSGAILKAALKYMF